MTMQVFEGNPLNVADQVAYESVFFHSRAFKWEPMKGEKGSGLTAMPKGLMRAVIYGDPNKPGLCMFRMRYPARYHVPSHVHWMAEHTAVLEGEVWVGLGEVVDESKMTKYSAGDFFSMAAGQPHYVLTKDSSPIFEFHVMGPWQMAYVDPNDHPHK